MTDLMTELKEANARCERWAEDCEKALGHIARLEAERDEAKTLLREGLVSAARACEHVEAEQDDEIARRVALEQARSDWRERATRMRAALTWVSQLDKDDGPHRRGQPTYHLVSTIAAYARAALAGEEADRLPDDTVCACLNDTGERKVEIVERCLRCGALMYSDAYHDAVEERDRLRAALSEIADDYLSDGDDLQEIANAALAGEEES